MVETMGMMNRRSIVIELIGGRTLEFTFPIQAREENASERIEEALNLPTLSISAEDILYVIPTASIQCLTIKPAPKKLPRTVIRAASRTVSGE